MSLEQEPPTPSLPENSEPGMEDVPSFGDTIDHVQRLQAIFDDPKVQEAAKAGVRTIVNIGISAADFIPVVGEIPSWLADASKIFKGTDTLTPDVSRKVAWGTELLEGFTGGAVPSHAVETTMQLDADMPRLKEGFARVGEIWRGEQADYRVNQPQIDEAIETFDVTPPRKAA